MSVYAALASLMQLLDDIILHNQYPTFLLGKRALIKSLHGKFGLLEESLQGYSSKGDEAAGRVEERIKDLAYRVQDVIDTEISRQIGSEMQQTLVAKKISHHPKTSVKQNIFAGMFPDFKSAFCRKGRPVECVGDLSMLEQEIASIVKEMEEIMKRQKSEGSLLDYDCIDVGRCEQETAGRDATVGFDEYLITIKDQLCGKSTHLQIIPIVGMGGIGKTTLARNTFNDDLILEHFYCRAWTTVSQHYSLKRVLQTILKALPDATMDLRDGEEEEEGKLKEKIYKSLKGERYLIVLDDVWSIQFWKGSSGFIHEMQFLNVDASWNLLRKKVFGQEYCAPRLENIGRFIASRCWGLPLAIVVIAGVLSNVRTPQYWEKVAENVGSILRRDCELQSLVSSSESLFSIYGKFAGGL